jgi:16S rRNA (guanine527-N7)-methyltransferase
MQDKLVKILEHYRIKGPEKKARKIDEYLRLLSGRREWARLTSKGFTENPENVVVDSLGILSVLDNDKKIDVVDIGSGGGIVGVVISIVCHEWEIVMVESSARKATFLTEAIGSLELGNARVERYRAESLSDSLAFNAAVGRATGAIAKITPIALRLLVRGGLYVAIKGSNVEAEIEDATAAIEASGGTLVGIKKPVYPGALGIPDRVSLVVIRKI